MADNYQDKVNLSIKNIEQNFEGGLSNTSTKKFDELPPAISHRNTRCVDRAGKYFLEYAA